jgi:hypothetical protein
LNGRSGSTDLAIERAQFALTRQKRLNGAAPESNRPSVGLPHRTGFEDLLGVARKDSHDCDLNSRNA